MAKAYVLTLRLSPAQRTQLARLSSKLGVDKTNLIRLAIARLAEAEGVLEATSGHKRP